MGAVLFDLLYAALYEGEKYGSQPRQKIYREFKHF
jgi:hypothetical protein